MRITLIRIFTALDLIQTSFQQVETNGRQAHSIVTFADKILILQLIIEQATNIVSNKIQKGVYRPRYKLL